jgi:hypothetical protein
MGLADAEPDIRLSINTAAVLKATDLAFHIPKSLGDLGSKIVAY